MRGNIDRQGERLVGEVLGEYEEQRLKGEYRKSRKKETGKRTPSKSKERSQDKGKVQIDCNPSMQVLTGFKSQMFWVLIIVKCMIIVRHIANLWLVIFRVHSED